MFTGIIEEVGTISKISQHGENRRDRLWQLACANARVQRARRVGEKLVHEKDSGRRRRVQRVLEDDCELAQVADVPA